MYRQTKASYVLAVGCAVIVMMSFISPRSTIQQVQASSGGTYYIDYVGGNDSNDGLSKDAPWKVAPEMVGFGGIYAHQAGDHFIFKGGVTWPHTALPLTIVNSGGGIGSEDVYTADVTWYTGGSWSRPIFDGENAMGKSNFLIGNYISRSAYIIIENLEFMHVGDPSDGSGTAIDFRGGTNIEIKNNIIRPGGIQAFSFAADGSSASRIYVHDNQISEAGRGVIYGYNANRVDDVRVYNNVWEGPKTLNSFGYHFDGFMTGRGDSQESCALNTGFVTNILFLNNKFYGDWSGGATGEYFSNGCTNHTTIYNNIFSLEDSSGSVNFSPGMVVFGTTDGNISVYNNTFSSDAYPGYGAGAVNAVSFENSYGNLAVKGNIFSGFGIDIHGDTANSPTYSIDYNLHNISLAGGYGELCYMDSIQMKSLADCQSQGYETHGLTGDPKFVTPPTSVTGSGDWHLQSGSPAIDAFPTNGAPTSIFTTDLGSSSRPQGSAWDIGAFESSGGGPTTYTVDITTTGTGSGTVTCGGSACPTSVVSGTSITLTESPSTGSTFTSWGGLCSGTSSTCTIIVSSNSSVSASFTLTQNPTPTPTPTPPPTPTTFTLAVYRSGTGSGTIAGGSISCGSTCAQSGISSGTSITLTASASSGSAFTGWSGAGCSGTSSCIFTVTADTSVTANFISSSGGGGGGGGGGSNNTPGVSTTTASTTNTLCPSGYSCVPAPKVQKFTRTLKLGSTGADVKRLKVFLNTHGFPIAVSGPGSSGQESSSYGVSTAAAISRFQVAHKKEILTPNRLTKGTGQFGVATMKVVNRMIGY